MLALLYAAAEPDKVPFYIAGGLVAVWAVVLVGDRPEPAEFPDGQAASAGVIGITFVLVVIAIGAAILTG